MYLPNIIYTWLAASVPFTSIPFASNPKRGIAHSGWKTHPKDVQHVADSQISWEYDWGAAVPPNLPEGVEHVPMQWGKTGFDDLKKRVKQQKAKFILGFNEPDKLFQSHIDPDEAAKLWIEHINPLKKKSVTLVSPAVSSASDGAEWLNDFFTACNNQCEIDDIALHWYGNGAQNFIDYLKNMHDKYPDKRIWVTEFADTSLLESEVVQFMKSALDFLDKTDWIARYAWYVYGRTSLGMSTHLVDAFGNLTALGELYVNGE